MDHLESSFPILQGHLGPSSITFGESKIHPILFKIPSSFSLLLQLWPQDVQWGAGAHLHFILGPLFWPYWTVRKAMQGDMCL